MRELTFNRPFKLQGTTIENGKRDLSHGEQYYSRFSVVHCKGGIVTALEFNWQTNKGKLYYTEFRTIIAGMVYTAYLEQANLSDQQLKWLATRFLNLLKQ